MSATAPGKLLEQLEIFNKSHVEPSSIPSELRDRLSAAARVTSLSLENSSETAYRVLLTQPIEAASVRIAADLHLFSALADKIFTTSELAEAVGAEPELLVRVLRSLSAFKAIKEVGLNKFASSPNYSLFRDPKFEDAFAACQDVLGKTDAAVPAHLAATGYRNPTDPTDAAAQYAYGIKGKSFMETFTKDIDGGTALQGFSTLMNVWAEGFTQISSIYPVEVRLGEGFDPESVMFVDIGGGWGQHTVALKKALPNLPGRFVVQDVPRVIETAPKNDSSYKGIEMVAHDFMTPQPIKGARCYYLCRCLHDWTDAVCVTILKQLKEAAKPGYSKILIHEVIVPEMGAGVRSVTQDFGMMSLLAAAERTEEQWRTLCDRAGLKVTGVFGGVDMNQEGIVEAVIET